MRKSSVQKAVLLQSKEQSQGHRRGGSATSAKRSVYYSDSGRIRLQGEEGHGDTQGGQCNGEMEEQRIHVKQSGVNGSHGIGHQSTNGRVGGRQ
jgi:hypothetical protein